MRRFLIFVALMLFPSLASAQNAIPQQCVDTSGSAIAQTCTTLLVIAAKDLFIYTPGTTNTGDLTINANTTGPKHVHKWGSQILAAGDYPAGIPQLILYDGTFYQTQTIGNPLAGPVANLVPDTKTSALGAMTSGAAILTDSSNPFAATDVGKHIWVSMWPVQQPAQTSITRAGGAGSISCSAGVAGPPGSAVQPTFFYAVMTETNAGGEGRPSNEMFLACNTNSTTQTLTVHKPAALNGATTWSAYIGTSSGGEALQTGCTGIAIASDCVLTSLAGSTAPTLRVASLSTTILSFQSSGQVTLSANATATVSGANYAWFTDNTAALQGAFNACPSVSGTNPIGCTITLPTGISGIASAVTTTKHAVVLGCAGGSTWLSGASTGSCTIGAADNIILLKQGTLASQENNGVRLTDVGFADLSGVGNAVGGLELDTSAHAYLLRFNAHNFTNGFGFYCNSGSSTVYCQYNMIIEPLIEQTHAAIVFGNGKHSNNFIVGGELTGPDGMGDTGIDFQQNATLQGGSSNHDYGTSIENFAVCVHSGDDALDDFNGTHCEENSGRGAGSLAFVIDASAAALANNSVIINVEIADFAVGVVIGTNVLSTNIDNVTPSTTTTAIVNNGTNTQIIGPTGYFDFPAFVGPYKSITGGCSLYVDSVTGLWTALNASNVNCLPGSGTTVTIASGTAVLGTSLIASGSCDTTAVGITATGAAVGDGLTYPASTDISAVTGYGGTSGFLTIYPYVGTNTVNFKVCNWTGSSITPGAVTLEWRDFR